MPTGALNVAARSLFEKGADADNALKATAIATGVLVIKHLATVMGQGRARFAAGKRPPEDAALNPKSGAQDFLGLLKAQEKGNEDKNHKAALETEARWTRILANDLENNPLGLIVAWGALHSPKSFKLHIALVSLFATSRVVHTFAYYKAKQPHRAIAWALGFVSIIGMSVNGIVGAFSKK